MPRPIWEGHLRLSLVTCQVALLKATNEGEGVHFHLLHPQTKHRVKQAWRDPDLGADAPDVPRASLLHGYELTKGEYVIIDDADLKAIRLESTKTIQIETFVDAKDIDRLYWDQPYFLTPSGKRDLQEPYAVIREAMLREGKVALGRVVMAGRERPVAIEVRGQGMLLSTLRAREEVRDEQAAFDDIADIKVDPQMLDIAKAIIAKQAGPFDPTVFHDRYAEAVNELVQRKAADHTVSVPKAEDKETNVIDLMDALRRSLDGAKATPAPPSPRSRNDQKSRPAPHKAEPKTKKTGVR